MKNILILLIFVVPFVVFSQNDNLSSQYAEIVLDNKPAFINVTTGAIVSEIPNAAKRKSTIVSQTVDTTKGAENHTITKGETLYSIAKKYNISIAQLKTLNPETTLDVLNINQEIRVGQNSSKIPTETEATLAAATIYVVEKGDTLYSISKKFSISVEDLKNRNGLTSNTLSIGQELIVK